MSKTIITTKIVNEWIELHKKGYACNRIAKMYNISSSSIRRHLNNRGIKTPKPKHFHFDVDYILCIYDKQDNLIYQFDNVNEMSEKLKIKRMTIFCNLSRNFKNVEINHKRYKIKKVRLD